jgi:16S rRNA (cytosine1402-N4)-methyltransferase
MESREDGQKGTRHKPVLLAPILNLFAPSSPSPLHILDCTLGGGGHSFAFLERWRDCTVIGLDRDIQAIERTAPRMALFGSRFTPICGNFEQFDQLISNNTLNAGASGRSKIKFDRILADFGFSSDQLDDQSRGFSHQLGGPLDMRLDQTSELTAATVVNSYSLGELIGVFRRGGVGPVSSALARAIVSARPIADASVLANLIRETVIPFERKRRKKGAQASGSDPATVPFQAIRIEVNGELTAIDLLLDLVPEYLAPGGVAAMISFHSLEDQIVTGRMRGWSQTISTGRAGPIEREPLGRLLTPKAITADEAELEENSRARSARLRAFRMSDTGAAGEVEVVGRGI